jgi:(1->4)-alpha-D-glucan 1-alpha-D-glucosylmutase
MSIESPLEALAQARGLALNYTATDGTTHAVPEESLRAILEALGCDTAEPARALAELEVERAGELASPVVASFEPAAPVVPLNVQAFGSDRLAWTLEGEDCRLEGRCTLDELEWRDDESCLALPDLVPGYYRVTITGGEQCTQTRLIHAPARAWAPATPERGYGLSVQLYEQTGAKSLGIGDFSDLAGLGEAAGRMGASTLGLNPLHALFLSAPERASPYSPNSRFALNPLYLDVRRLPGMTEALRERMAGTAFAAHAKALNAQPLIDYVAVAETKLAIAREAFENFRTLEDARAFASFCQSASSRIRDWADYESIAAVHGANAGAWPAPLREREAEALARFGAEHAEEKDFYLWLQWQSAVQLEVATERAERAGLTMGFYQDLALGADPIGAEIWAGGADYVRGVSVGAPPDTLNPGGQNWGFPPLDPRRLIEQGLVPFIELIRENMRHAGVLRIDHVLGLNRLFVIPAQAGASEGAYLRYPLELMLAAIVLESHHSQCLVIGEDLGTVPDGLRERLAERGILSLRLLYFEHGETGQPRTPEAYPREALAAVGTHDLAPLAGWWHEDDIERNDRHGFWPTPEAGEAARAARAADRTALTEAFLRAGWDDAGGDPPAAGAYRWLARAPSRLLTIQPEDALDISAPVNVPGTTTAEPNWRRRRLPPWPEWLADPRLLAVIRVVQAERGERARRGDSPPVATYRLQLHEAFDFRDAGDYVPYLARLGVSHLYLSPVMASVPGSMHGYDMCDPARLDAERGGKAGFNALLDAARNQGLALIADFVPNHMAAHRADPWWMDLLEWGHASVHDATFDVDWSAEGGHLVLPVLGEPLDALLERGEIKLAYEPSGRFCAAYFERRFPLAPETVAVLPQLLARRLDDSNLSRLARRLHALRELSDDKRRAAGLSVQAALARHVEDNALAGEFEKVASEFTRTPKPLERLLAAQHWRLLYWRRGADEVNYRRFFDIGDLAALHMERPGVFAAAHVGVRRLLAEGAVAGLRLDHVDGLAAPGDYLETLAELAEANGVKTSLWVEKILAADESLPPWPVAGTTGYEFLNDVTRFFMTESGAARLRTLWREIDLDARDFSRTLALAKREVIEEAFSGMLERVADALASRAPLEAGPLQAALLDFLVALSIYRGYFDAPATACPTQEARVVQALEAVTDEAARSWLTELLTDIDENSARLPAALRDGVMRLWQLASAAMAKGLEDTAFYRDFALLALNEVGGDPRWPTLPAARFHERLHQRANDWPLALNAGATHDTKRGEDARLRLAMLASHAERWAALVAELREAVVTLRPSGLHPADEYLVFQTLLAVWPAPATSPLSASVQESLAKRLHDYFIKALREGKQRTAWTQPDEAYEAGVASYATALLDPEAAPDFQRLFRPFAAAIAKSGALASLAALTLKCTAPGVPDIYQGTELWDLSLVDPDNRRPVDYPLRDRLLGECLSGLEAAGEAHLRALRETWPDGRIKLYCLERLLQCRREHAALFAHGDYEPVSINGSLADKALAYRRVSRDEDVVIVIARVGADLVDAQRFSLDGSVWGDTRLELGSAVARHELFTGRRFMGEQLALERVLDGLPAAVLLAE